MRVALHRLAAQDFDHALRYYRQEAGAAVASRLRTEIDAQLALLCQHPRLGTPVANGRRMQPLAQLSYSLIYREDGERLLVLVLRHQRRHPSFGESRR